MVKTFRLGGVHPSENKLSAASPIKQAELPKQAVFSTYQHIGAPAKPVVAKGDVVKVGTLLAEADGFVSAPVYSSVSGKVNKVDAIVDASGYRRPAIFVDVEGDEWEESIDRSTKLVKLSDRPDLTPQDIVAKIKAAGVVGMGGATFPCHVKLSPPPGTKAEYVIINAVECEPYLTADHRLMLEKADEILVGVALIMKAVGVTKGFIAIENNKPDAIRLMTEKAAAYPEIEVVPLKVKYPQGGEKQLIQAVIGREVPAPPAIPIHVGAVVQNVGTAFAIYEAVMKNKPLIERVITVTGKSVKSPSNFLARIGTPMSTLIDACGGLPEDTGKVIGGGPMMGKALLNLDIPVCKGSSGLLIMNEKEARRGEEQPCIRCAKCVDACPMGLAPYLLATSSAFRNWEKAEQNNIVSCIECGSCQFTCPSNRQLLDNIRVGKSTVMGLIRARNAKK
ncbi:MAG: electron transport complex subunit RsxC [Paraprevotella sp.]|nr:electron transport complex subunit RsxC [Paraprevotella sp.]MBP3473088.1 electron transport complex subunit RsxC [Paraprevotella sp.]